MKTKLSFLARSVIIVFMLLAGTVSGWAAKLYLSPGTNWLTANARFAVYYFKDGDTHWCDMKEVNGTSYYESDDDIPAGYKVIFCRMDPGTTENNWGNKWNQTKDLTLEDGKNLYTYPNNGDWDKDENGSWSLYETYSVDVSAGEHGSVSPAGKTQVGPIPVSITATPAAEYVFSEWQTTGSVTVADVRSASTTITATGVGTVTATFVEKPADVHITVAVRTTDANGAAYYWNSETASTAYFWVRPDGEFPGDEVTSKLTHDGHKYFYKTYTVPYGSTLKIRVHNQAMPSSSTYDIRSEEICIENVTTDKTYYYSLGAYMTSDSGNSYSIFETIEEDDYYLVVNNTRSAGVPGTDIVRYKFQPVLNRGKVDADLSSTLYTLTLPDFVLTGAQERAENPNCFTATLDNQPTMYYTIQKGDGTVIYQPGENYELGYDESGKRTEDSNGGLTNVQMESYGAHINKSKTAAATEGYNFFLKKGNLAKSYTWYLNIGKTAYAPAANNPRFISNAQSVAIAANQLVSSDEYKKHAIVEQNNASGVQDYYLTGNLKAGAGAMTWDPVKDKMKMTRMLFLEGKSYVAGSADAPSVADCDSIVYVLQMVRPEAGWGNMFLSMAGERNLNAFKNGIEDSDVTAWWATLIRPQVFTNKDAQWNFGGLEVNGSLNDGSYTTSYGNTSQAINPILDDNVTGYTAYFNMTNATYRLVYYKESYSNDEGLFIIGPAVGETHAEHPYNAENGQKVKLTFDAPTGAYVAKNVKLTNGKKFRFANILNTTITKNEGGEQTTNDIIAYESFYEEDDFTSGAPKTSTKVSSTHETSYFNLLSNLKNIGDAQEPTNSGKDVLFDLPTGTYNVRFYTKYLGANGETVTNAYYTIDENIPCPIITNDPHEDRAGFGYYKNWSSHLAYKFNATNVKCYYVKKAIYNKEVNKDDNVAKYHNKITLKENKTGYLPSEFAMILASDDPTAHNNIYIIKPGDPYGYAAECKITDASVYSKENGTGYFEPVVDGLSNCGDLTSELVGSGKKKDGKYITRNYLFSTFKPEGSDKKVLGFWRFKESNTYISAHKCVLRMPCDDDDWEVGTYTAYDPVAGQNAAKNVCLFIIEGEEFEDDNDDIVTGIADNSISEQQNSNVFNVMGMKLSAPGKGINIINGKKVLRK